MSKVIEVILKLFVIFVLFFIGAFLCVAFVFSVGADIGIFGILIPITILLIGIAIIAIFISMFKKSKDAKRLLDPNITKEEKKEIENNQSIKNILGITIIIVIVLIIFFLVI